MTATDSVDLRQMWLLMAEVYAAWKQKKQRELFVIFLVISLPQNFGINNRGVYK